MWRRSRERKDAGSATGAHRSFADTPAQLQESGSSGEPLQHGDSLDVGRTSQAAPSATAAAAAVAAAGAPTDLTQEVVSASPAVEPLAPTEVEMEADLYQSKATEPASAATTQPPDVHDGAASPAFEPPAPTQFENASHPQQLEAVAPPAPQADTLPPEVHIEWAAGLPSGAGFILPDGQLSVEPQVAEAESEEPVQPTDRMLQPPADADAEPHLHSPEGSSGKELQPQQQLQPRADSSDAEPQSQWQSLAAQEVQGSGEASEDLELALQRLMAVSEIPCASSGTSSDEAGAQQPEPPAGAATLVPLAAQSLMPAAAEGDGAALAPVPAALNRRRSSVAGQALTRAARRHRSLRLTATGRQAEAGHTAAAAASPRAAGQAPAPQPAMGEVADSSADILAELEAQRARHAEQLRLEGKVRAELESMISRIEAHFKKEQAARKWAEEQLAAAAADRDALAAQLEGERAQQAALLQQAVQERGMAEEGLRAELEAARQELSSHSEAMSAELAAWRGSADAAARELEEQAREFAARWQQLAERLHGGGMVGGAGQRCPGPGGAGISASTGQGQGGQRALHFHRSQAAATGSEGSASQITRSSPGASARGTSKGASERSLPRLPGKKTQAVFGAQLRQPGEASSVGSRGSATLPVLRSAGAAGRLQHERSSGMAWSSQGDRYSESKRDAGMVAHMAARWNRG